jgi:hypothetical protein
MRAFYHALAFALGTLSLGLPNASGAGFGLFRNFWGDVIVATDMLPDGRELTLPTPDKPVYYLGRSLGARLGTIPGDHMPDEKLINQVVTRILAKQGYLGARPGANDPTLFLVVQWGYLDPRTGDNHWFLGYNPNQDIGAAVFPGMLGPEVFRLNFRSHMIETVLDSAKGPLYGIIITAFEYQSARTEKPIVYWQSRIGLPANGKSMAEALPVMLLAAGTAIGRESGSPVLLDADEVRDGQVKLGELQFLEDSSEAPRTENPGARK